MSLSLLLEQTLNGFQQGMTLFLMASGLTLTFGIMGLINLAHGSLYARGGEETVVVLMHPRANFAHHYVVPALLDALDALAQERDRWPGAEFTEDNASAETLAKRVFEGGRVSLQLKGTNFQIRVWEALLR